MLISVHRTLKLETMPESLNCSCTVWRVKDLANLMVRLGKLSAHAFRFEKLASVGDFT